MGAPSTRSTDAARGRILLPRQKRTRTRTRGGHRTSSLRGSLPALKPAALSELKEGKGFKIARFFFAAPRP